jgi:hypothetical protein
MITSGKIYLQNYIFNENKFVELDSSVNTSGIYLLTITGGAANREIEYDGYTGLSIPVFHTERIQTFPIKIGIGYQNLNVGPFIAVGADNQCISPPEVRVGDANDELLIGSNNLNLSGRAISFFGFNNFSDSSAFVDMYGNANFSKNSQSNNINGSDNMTSGAESTNIFGYSNAVLAYENLSKIYNPKGTGISFNTRRITLIGDINYVTSGGAFINNFGNFNNFQNSQSITSVGDYNQTSNTSGSNNGMFGARNDLTDSYNSFSFGAENTIIKDQESFTFGNLNKIGDTNQTGINFRNYLIGDRNTTIRGYLNFIVGKINTVHGEKDFVFGQENQMEFDSDNNFAVGSLNILTGADNNYIFGKSNEINPTVIGDIFDFVVVDNDIVYKGPYGGSYSKDLVSYGNSFFGNSNKTYSSINTTVLGETNKLIDNYNSLVVGKNNNIINDNSSVVIGMNNSFSGTTGNYILGFSNNMYATTGAIFIGFNFHKQNRNGIKITSSGIDLYGNIRFNGVPA